MKFCSVVLEELRWQAASVVNFRKFLTPYVVVHITRKICGSYAPLNLKIFQKFTTEAACQRNSSETTEQNLMNLGR
jgi:hypothetical protein